MDKRTTSPEYLEWKRMVDEQVCRVWGFTTNDVEAPYEEFFWERRLSPMQAAAAVEAYF